MNIYEAIADIMKTGYSIGKDKRNPQQGFMYRGIDDVMNVFQPLMAARGIFVVPEVLEATREERQTAKGTNLIYSVLKIRYTFYASDGTSVSAVVIGEGMDSGDKASNKAMAVGMKYALFQVFCIPTEEMRRADPDGETPEPSKPEPKPEVEKPCFCAYCGNTILPYIRSGKKIGIDKHVDGSMKKFGKVYCIDCIEKGYATAKEENHA